MNQSENSKITYKSSGVDIDAGDALVEKIKPLAKSTVRTGSDADLGGFGGLFDIAKAGFKDPVLVSATDGVGTKLKIANEINKHDTIGIDLVAMCVNDLVVQGAEPLFFLDYFATGRLDVNKAHDVIKGIADGCKQAGCALIGGETAEMPGMYSNDDYDLAGFAVGAVERDKILPKSNIKEGDVILGLPSSGLHSNGFSLIRNIISKTGAKLSDKIDSSKKSLGDILIEPTKIYVSSCLNILKNNNIKAMAHITGGGLVENIPRVIPDTLGVEIDCSSWPVPDIFKWIFKKSNIEKEELLRTLNCGIGMVIIAENDVLKNTEQKYFVIGRVVKKDSEKKVVLKNTDEFCK